MSYGHNLYSALISFSKTLNSAAEWTLFFSRTVCPSSGKTYGAQYTFFQVQFFSKSLHRASDNAQSYSSKGIQTIFRFYLTKHSLISGSGSLDSCRHVMPKEYKNTKELRHGTSGASYQYIVRTSMISSEGPSAFYFFNT